nr:low-density lipoprotein receptor-related protein 8-like [Salvelinus alpinus]
MALALLLNYYSPCGLACSELPSHGGLDASELHNANACPAKEFQCHNRKCVAPIFVCDGDDDCGDWSDEEKCSISSCSSHEFRCNDSECIPALWSCDGDPDCGDKSDESMERCSRRTEPQKARCSAGEFQCGSGECVHLNWKCDGEADCKDKSDEADCALLTCRPDEFQCGDGSCIHGTKQCNRVHDCPDFSDEAGCINALWAFLRIIGTQNCFCISMTSLEIEYQTTCPSQTRPVKVEYQTTCPSQTRPVKVEYQNNLSFSDKTCEDKTCEGRVADNLSLSDKTCEGRVPDNLSFSDKICEDIDECQQPDSCSQICINYKGDYKCECYQGYEMDPSTKTCKAVALGGRMEKALGGRTEEALGGRMEKALGGRTEKALGGRMEKAPGGRTEKALGGRTEKALGGRMEKALGGRMEKALGGRMEKALGGRMEKALGVPPDSRSSFNSASTQPDSRPTFKLRQYRLTLVPPSTPPVPPDSRSSFNSTRWEMGRCVWLIKLSYRSSQVVEDAYINKASDSSEQVTLIETALSSPEGLAVDWVHNNIYWTDSGDKTISVATGDGKKRKVLIDTELSEPRAIAVDPRQGRSYLSNRRLYWVDSKLHLLSSIDLNGDNRKVLLFSQDHLGHPFALTVFEDRVYWTDLEDEAIYSANRLTGHDVATLAEHLNNPLDVVVFHELRQPKAPDSCNMGSLPNGGCEYLCLKAPQITDHSPKYTCACPDGMELGPAHADR